MNDGYHGGLGGVFKHCIFDGLKKMDLKNGLKMDLKLEIFYVLQKL